MVLCKAVMVLSGHTQSVTGIKWGGEGLIYTASQDRTIKVWRTKDVSLCVIYIYVPLVIMLWSKKVLKSVYYIMLPDSLLISM